ncbi:phosphatase PAP2 family protein [Yinghuangia sp. ASG 101]|uniref:phosphatase PAP2 family protein n=1 Tax=Yinghuangia sp. ASG 101 TaxID=2896848 RepID=UPI001E3A31FE|nr:phosphatase PAP2 family protein [Yinghuangia sp. ASG 101]UGQ14058.1 phosphatase PAP2 family protein [Yinghuangia sp. ASG 101]
MVRFAASPAFPVTLLLLLGAITAQVLAGGTPVTALDRAVRDGLLPLTDALSGAWPDRAVHGVAALGGPVPGALVLAATVVCTARRTRVGRRPFLAAVAVVLMSVAATMALVFAGKRLTGRPGPTGDPLAPGQWGFFPSGHSATSAVCFGGAVLLARAVLPPGRATRLGGAVATALCAMVGFALLWCGYHWISDVIAAWALTGTVLWLAGTSLRHIPHEGRGRRAVGEPGRASARRSDP